jgi:hypothetical protein
MRSDPLITRLARANPAPLEPAREAVTDTPDPLETRLFAAIAQDTHTPQRRRVLGGTAGLRRAHPIALAMASLIACASAAAAIVSLSGHSSQPLAGQVPGSHIVGTQRGVQPESGDSYRITVAPDLQAGDAGWCTDIQYSAGGKPAEGSGGCETGGSYPTISRPVFGSFAHWGFPASAPSGDTVGYVLTGPGVAAIRIGSKTILAKSQPGLPAGDKAAVFFLPAKSPPVIVPPAGTPYPYDIRVPSVDPYLVRVSKSGNALPPPAHPALVRAIPILALNEAGQVIHYGSAKTSALGNVKFWQRSASDANRLHGISRTPRPGACTISQHGLTHLKPVFGRTVQRIVPRPDLQGQGFLSCLDTYYTLEHWPIRAAVLLDAHNPGGTLSPIPGSSAVPGQPNIINVPLPGLLPGAITARREGNAWLIVQGGRDETQRLQALRALRITKPAGGK